jgi:hypothetical protein
VLLVVNVPVYSQVGPGRAFLLGLTNSVDGPNGCSVPACAGPQCQLPLYSYEYDDYTMAPSAADDAHWYLGNGSSPTTLPVSVSFRPLYGPNLDDAIDIGLPLDPVPAVLRPTPSLDILGPNGSTPLQYDTYIQPGCYERTAAPYAPLSSAFPPEIKLWPPNDDRLTPTTSFDTTTEEVFPAGTSSPFPTFEIARAEGLEGWTAYLRSVNNGRVYSNVAALRGSVASNVTLLTNHENERAARDPDALTGLELVVAPPRGAPLPTIFFAPTGLAGAQELPAHEEYPSLPTPVVVSGHITTKSSQPVPATVVFTAVDIMDKSGNVFPPNFEFTTQVSTTGAGGGETYSALLPRGDYLVSVRPTDGVHAVTVVTKRVGPQGDVVNLDIDVVPLVPVNGRAMVADGRELADATVEAVPVACASNAVSAACLPVGGQTVTDDTGAYVLGLDPGTYILRVKPAGGTQLPWVSQKISVGTTAQTVSPVVPVPVVVNETLVDTSLNPVPRAIVRVFTKPSMGNPPQELGQAMTDNSGNFALYLAPAADVADAADAAAAH